MPRPTQATIDFSALAHNLAVVRQYAPRSRIMAVIKADAYGHGLLHAANALKTVDGFALLELDAAICLRDAGYRQPILLLEGFFSTQELGLLEQYQLSTVIHHSEQVAMLLESKQRVDLFLKINTGMNRLGLAPEQFHKVMSMFKGNRCANTITLMTHFACADDPSEKESVIQQLQYFEMATQGYNYPRSLANSAAIIRYPETHADWVRPGIMLYGISPFPDQTASDLNLRPVMTLSSRIIAIQNLKCGDKVGYHGLFQADRAMRIGIVACGYADGYPRHAPTNTPVLVNNQHTRLLGRVSMDMLAVDLTDIENAELNSPVILWGKEITVDEIAHRAGTIGYELLCAVAPRVEKVCF
ncbi:alanine racemase [Nitrosomonas sp. Nm166]|uniref:alanine racemase n=1 Tax=Nitrosomonas sp. Nm166 TaxID=1881054 RepID=UPI0008E61B4E|nr:alanine racemase [Nitrosomonas sp. Nm166]SFE73835.1 alanine racemase [Nitrosomonas sp. Nm166]